MAYEILGSRAQRKKDERKILLASL